MAQPSTDIWVADRHPLFRGALCSLLQTHLPSARIQQIDAMTSLEARLAQDTSARLLIIDLTLPGLHGLQGLANLSVRHPELPIMAMCDQPPDSLAPLLGYGAIAGITKSVSPGQFTEAVTAVLQGQCWLPPGTVDRPYCTLNAGQPEVTNRIAKLTPRRQVILGMVADGMLNKQIAHELGLCESTIKAHISSIMKIMHVRNRTQIATTAIRLRDAANSQSRLPARTPDNPDLRQTA